jgi:ABC-type transporter Mla subunit MlaD
MYRWFKSFNPKEFSSFFTGAFIAAALIIFLVILVAALHHNERLFNPEYSLYCNFDRNMGLNTGAKVQIVGVHAGRVAEILLTPQGTVRVRLRISKKFQHHITNESRIFLTRDQNVIFSDRVVYITHGSGQGRILEDGDEIETTDAQDIETVIANMTKLLDQIGNIALVGDSLLRMAMNPQSTVGALLGSDDLYAKVDQQVKQLAIITESVESITRTVEAHMPTFVKNSGSMLRDGAQIMAKGNQIADSGLELMGYLQNMTHSGDSLLYRADVLIAKATSLITQSEDKLERLDALVKGASSHWILRSRIATPKTVELNQELLW